MDRRVDCCADWSDLAQEWELRPGVTYLNHGSFGPSPRIVRQTRRQWIDQLDSEPMDFFVRQLEPALATARQKTADFLGTTLPNFVFVENATYGMNVVADSFPLNSGDEILLNDHEYGAVIRIWERRAKRTGAQVVVAKLPERFESADELRQALERRITPRTRVAILSHITSATALIFPLAELLPVFRNRNIATVIDGPHAPAHIPLNLEALDCDFYVASLHKWLCAPLGTGFVYAHPRQHHLVQPVVKSWGRLLPAVPETWDEEFTWPATRDPSGYLSVPAAIEFMETVGLTKFRDRACYLASTVEEQIISLTGQRPLGDRAGGWYGTMAHVPLPSGDWTHLQRDLWTEYQIETPVINFQNRWFIRVSCHLYTNQEQIAYLIRALHRLLAR